MKGSREKRSRTLMATRPRCEPALAAVIMAVSAIVVAFNAKLLFVMASDRARPCAHGLEHGDRCN